MPTQKRLGWWAVAIGLVLCTTTAPAWAVDSDGDGVDDAVDVCNNTPPGTAVDAAGRPLGDVDQDCDTDMDDFALFQQGFTGPLITPISIETVAIGNPGNAGELSGQGAGGFGPDRICGAVDYVYDIGKFEVTAGQYTAFLNAVATTDTYGLYNPTMWSSDYGCKIQRSGSSGRYTYSVPADSANRPVNRVSWGDAARFANWLHNGQPTGAQDLSTTEDGSYFINGAMSDAELLAVVREPDATWVIPSEDEWYKAAYHKNDGVTGNYFEYPTSSDCVPSNNLIDPDPGNNATFWDNGYTIGSPYYRTEVGMHENSESPYGTFDQGGNVWEWNEEILDGWARSQRGGSFHGYGGSSYAYFLLASFRDQFVSPTGEDNATGFRVAKIPVSGPLGACCYSAGGCVVETEADCAGVWQGAGTSCDPNPCAASVVIETVPVGNPGNAGELSGEGAGGLGPDRICGAVDYVFEIGTFEVTAGQYAAFLNAVAATDTYDLYDAEMWWQEFGCKIERTGSSGSYTYSVAADWADRPVNYVSWGDAARFANWLHNGQPIGAQDISTTEDGSYFLNGAMGNAELLAVVREPDATWVVPSEDEWYKAAYHKNDGVTGHYWGYPMGSNAVPDNGNPGGDSGNSANFYDGDYAIGSPYWRTEVGEFQNSAGPYGTFDQGGNVWEWNEAVIESTRAARGGWVVDDVTWLHASNRSAYLPPTYDGGQLGFRVTKVSASGLLGACCYPTGVCIVGTEADCAGAWQGAGTNCDPNPCTAPVAIETVTIGNAGNVEDTRYETPGYGAVDYTYNIGKYEVTAGQYTAFLNAVAATDTYGVYKTNMWSHQRGCRIERIGAPGSYAYRVATDWANRPVNYVSWGDAARFANWLHNGQPTGMQDLTTTEDGSYFLNGAMTYEELLAVLREPDATWVIPSEDEWYKAAYHKNDGVTGNYWDYPIGSSLAPDNGNPGGDSGNSANFDDGDFTIGSPYWRTEVGYFGLSDSPYGTFDQGGNVSEWTEAVWYATYRVWRGGSFLNSGHVLRADFRLHGVEDAFIGFRLCEMP